MARPLVILALVLFTIAGLASADTVPGDTASEAAAAAVPSFGPTSDDQIGTSEDDGSHEADAAVEAPVGGPVTPGAFAPGPDSSSQSGATIAEVSAIAAAVAAASYFF